MTDPVELIGYLASGLVVLSLTMGSVLRLRVISLVGSLVFGAYGLLIASIPIVVTNAAIAVINVYRLAELWRDVADKSYFEVVPWPVTGVYLPRFLAFHAQDIARDQPGFEGLRDDHTALMVLRDAVPVGVIALRVHGDGRATIDLDYVVPAHRDFQAATYVYGPQGPFAPLGLRVLEAHAGSPHHRRYLERFGFVERSGVYVRDVT